MNSTGPCHKLDPGHCTEYWRRYCKQRRLCSRALTAGPHLWLRWACCASRSCWCSCRGSCRSRCCLLCRLAIGLWSCIQSFRRQQHLHSNHKLLQNSPSNCTFESLYWSATNRHPKASKQVALLAKEHRLMCAEDTITRD